MKANGVKQARRERRRHFRRALRSNFLVRSFYFLAGLVLRALGVRFIVNSTPGRIGHLVAEIDWFLKQIRLGDRPAPRVAVWLIRRDRAANACLLDYWGEHVRIISSRRGRKPLAPFAELPNLRIPLAESVIAINETAKYPRVLARWGDRPPLLRLREDHRRRGEAALRELGVPDGSWFVCVHSREGGYSPQDEYMHTYRNSAIDSYVLAIQAVVERGGWCVRVGDPSMKPLAPMPGVVDYASSTLKSDWMDVYLCAACRFFLGNSSGLCLVSNAFGVPSALAHLTPLSAAYPAAAHDIGIPKLLRRSSGELMSFAEILASPIANFRFTELYAENNLTVVDNTPEEIAELALEILDRVEGRAVYTEEDVRLQQDFRNLFRPDHYSYGAASRIGRDFLRRHAAPGHRSN